MSTNNATANEIDEFLNGALITWVCISSPRSVRLFLFFWFIIRTVLIEF